jgi:DNA-binding PadR family transcriptional regulator
MFPPFRWMMHRRRGLRGWIVSILASAPKNGAEIMDEIETMTQGWWRPSPGSVYPLLEQMTQEDLLRKRDDGRYELSPKAKEEIEWPFGMPARKAQTVEDMVNEIVGFVSYLEDLNRSDRSKLMPVRAKIKDVADRLAALVGSGKT